MTASSHVSLAAKYRPQTFAAVAGQEAITRVLSRAVAEGQVAPAYLFSGTRGVGKTTVARILAKALNCVNGPAPEPCNACAMCRKVTAGVAVDVLEIDGATHTGIDAVRQLQEDVAQLPLEARRKVVIIDEAHMLSKSAFNGLLKTLEEPPAHVTFVLASTEPEKFPITIRSRCQHFVFQRLAHGPLAAHLAWVLEQERVDFEPAAVRLVARRGAGSVRDAMSLLSQVLALAGGRLTAAAVREALGMVDFATYLAVLQAAATRDLATLHAVVGRLADQGMDLGFFVRELTALWRDVFLLARLGDAARPLLDLPEEDAAALAQAAARFSPGHAHAAWQMGLEAQRGVTHSPDPALALELHLVNLALIPELVPVEQVSGPPAPKAAAPAPVASSTESAAAQPARVARGPETPQGQESAAAGEAGKQGRPAEEVAVPRKAPPTWEDVVALLADQGLPSQLAGQLRGAVQGDEVVITPVNAFAAARLEEFLAQTPVESLVAARLGRSVRLRVEAAAAPARKTKQELRQLAKNHPGIQAACQRFGAKIVDVWPNTGGQAGE